MLNDVECWKTEDFSQIEDETVLLFYISSYKGSFDFLCLLKLYTTQSFVLLIVIDLVEVFSLETCCCHNTQLKNLILAKCVTNRLVSCLAWRNTYTLTPKTNRLNVIYAMKSLISKAP